MFEYGIGQPIWRMLLVLYLCHWLRKWVKRTFPFPVADAACKIRNKVLKKCVISDFRIPGKGCFCWKSSEGSCGSPAVTFSGSTSAETFATVATPTVLLLKIYYSKIVEALTPVKGWPACARVILAVWRKQVVPAACTLKNPRPLLLIQGACKWQLCSSSTQNTVLSIVQQFFPLCIRALYESLALLNLWFRVQVVRRIGYHLLSARTLTFCQAECKYRQLSI